METANTIPKNVFAETTLSVGTEQWLHTIETSFSARGLSKAAREEAKAQEHREAQTRAGEPRCYRLNDGNVGYYRKGKESMSADDLLAYIEDTHALRTRDTDFSADLYDDDMVYAGECDKALSVSVRHVETPSMKEKIIALPKRVVTLPKCAVQAVRVSRSKWFNFERADTSAESRRFPLSALAAIVAVAISLMLIVASAVMITAGENEVDELNVQLDALSAELGDLNSDIDVCTNLLQIRGFAVSELGMVNENYLNMEYLSVDRGDAIEVIEEKEENKVSLSTLLSAIGFK